MGRSSFALVGGLALLVLTGALGTVLLRGQAEPDVAAAAPAPPAITVVVPTPVPTPAVQRVLAKAPRPRRHVRHPAARPHVVPQDRVAVAPAGVASFYRVYETAQKTFQVSWLLLASIHQQETAFSTDPTTYRGLNFAGCCAGPMQFNVKNGPISTWERYRAAFRFGTRPAAYAHRTAIHPSIYDDFDSVMAAAALLRDGGASLRLDAGAWRAAYDYYGHDLTGVDYADQVIARAIGWGQHGFCPGCGTDPSLLAAVEAAYGAPVRAQFTRPRPRAARVR